MINCDHVARLMMDYVDRQLTERDIQTLEYHLQACSHCFGHTEFMKALKALIKKKMILEHMSIETRHILCEKLSAV